jgi:3-dehydroquinate dehydratase
VLAAGARGFLCGFGALGYEMSLRGLVNTLRNPKR